MNMLSGLCRPVIFFVLSLYPTRGIGQEAPAIVSSPTWEINYGESSTFSIKVIDGGLEATVTHSGLPHWLSFLSDAMVSTFAGSDEGNQDGQGTMARFMSPAQVALDADGNVYVVDWQGHRIRVITPEGVVTTLAGTGEKGHVDGPAAAAQFTNPRDVAVDVDGNLYVADQGNHCIRKITPEGVVTTLAGTGVHGFKDGNPAQFDNPTGVTVDELGNVYVADYNNHRIRKITPEGEVSTVAGASDWGDADGPAGSARFDYPSGVAVDRSGNLFVTDENNHRIRKIAGGMVSTVAGGAPGFADGVGSNAQFNSPTGPAVDVEGNVYVADFNNHRIRKITPEGEVSTVAGASERGDADGPAVSAQFNQPTGVVVDRSGKLLVADRGNHRIRRIEQSWSLTAMPDKSHVGTHTIQLSATNDVGGFDQELKIIVKDPIPPEAKAFSPANGAVDVPLRPTLSITFDEEVMLADNGTFIILDGAVPIRTFDLSLNGDRDRFVLSGDKKTMSLLLMQALPHKKLLAVGMSPGFVTDKSRNAFAGFTAASGTWRFTTNDRQAQSITFNALSDKTYGDPAFDPGATTTSGLELTYSSSSHSVAVVESGLIKIVGAGTTIITAMQPGDENYYPATAQQQELEVRRRVVTITADNKTRFIRETNPEFTATYEGFVEGEDETVLRVQPVITTTADIASPAGEYPITVSGAEADNYEMRYFSGVLTVAPPDRVTIMANNILTPNSDGVNDKLVIQNIEFYPEHTVRIFDRAGRQLYSKSNYRNDWTGTFNGALLAEDTYYYVVDFGKGIPPVKGFVTIIRR